MPTTVAPSKSVILAPMLTLLNGPAVAKDTVEGRGMRMIAVKFDTPAANPELGVQLTEGMSGVGNPDGELGGPAAVQ